MPLSAFNPQLLLHLFSHDCSCSLIFFLKMQLIQLTFPPWRATPHPTLRPTSPPLEGTAGSPGGPKKGGSRTRFPLGASPAYFSLHLPTPLPDSLPRPDNAPSPATGAGSIAVAPLPTAGVLCLWRSVGRVGHGCDVVLAGSLPVA